MDQRRHIPLANIIDLLVDAICIVDAEGRYLFVSAAFERIFGYSPEEVIGQPMIDLVFPEDRTRTLEAARQIMAGHAQPHFENRYVRKDGQIVHIMWSARWSAVDQARVAVARDITELKRSQSIQDALFEISEAASTAEHLVALCGRTHQIIGELLPARNFFVALHDEKRNELHFPYFVDEHDPVPAPRPFDSGTLTAEVIRTGRALLLTPDSMVALSEHVSPTVGMDSIDWLGVPLSTSRGVIGALVVQSYSGDVRYTEQHKALLQFVSSQVAIAIERKQALTLLQHASQHDPLTDLPNRALVLRRLELLLASAKLDAKPLAVLYIDLDAFKQVNDALGHSVGDLLLQQAAQRMQRCVRETDTVGRMGGDEFMVLLHDIGLPHAEAVAEKIRTALAIPFELNGHSLTISASIGVAGCPQHGVDSGQLIERADKTMYSAKRNGGNRLMVAG